MSGLLLLLMAGLSAAAGGSVLDGLLRREHVEEIPIITTTLTQTVFTLPLPTLPTLALPALPTRATVTSTKTVYLETTKVTTVHPVCVTMKNNLPPCVTMPRPAHYPYEDMEESYQYLTPPQPQAQPAAYPEHRYNARPKIQPTAPVHLPEVQETRLLGEVTQSEPIEELFDNERTARYLMSHSDPTTEVRAVEDAVESQLRQSFVDRLLPPVFVVTTKTLWVTKVNQVRDDRVTATLVASNCLPVQSEIPFCHPMVLPPPPPPHRPYHHPKA